MLTGNKRRCSDRRIKDIKYAQANTTSKESERAGGGVDQADVNMKLV